MGKDHYTAAREGTAEIGLAVAATTFSIVVVFVPIAFMGGLAQQWFAPFALTIACSVLVSLFVSFSLDPMLSAYWPDPHMPMERAPLASRALLDRFNHWFDRQADRYKRVIGWALDHRFAMVGLAVASFVGALALPAMGLIGGGFIPVMDELGVQRSSIETPPGLQPRLHAAQGAGSRRASRATLPEVAYTYTTHRRPDRVRWTRASSTCGSSRRRERDRQQDVVEADLRARAARARRRRPASISTGNFGELQADPAAAAGARHRASCRQLAERCRDEVRQVPGAVDVGLSTKGQKPEIDVAIDRGLAGSLGVTVGAGRAGAAAGVCRHRRRRLDRPAGRDARRLRAPGARGAHQRQGPGAAAALRCSGPEGTRRRVPLGQVARVDAAASARRASITSTAIASSRSRPTPRGARSTRCWRDIDARLAERAAAARLRAAPGRRVARTRQRCSARIFAALGAGGAADVLRAGACSSGRSSTRWRS